MVSDQPFEPSSKPAIENWVGNDAVIGRLPQTPVHQLYRAMGFLIELTSRMYVFASAHLGDALGISAGWQTGLAQG